MFWWWFAPQVHYPLSGAVDQDISPTLLAQSGNPGVERAVLENVASYGSQIGALSEVVLALAGQLDRARLPAETTCALDKLRDIRMRVAILKAVTSKEPAPAGPERWNADSDDAARAIGAVLDALYARRPDVVADWAKNTLPH